MNQPDLGTGQPDQVMWKLAPLIVLTFGMITFASACGGEGQEVRPAPIVHHADNKGMKKGVMQPCRG